MNRRSSSLAAAVSLVSCALVVILWGASYVNLGGWVALRRVDTAYILLTHRGELLVQRAHGPFFAGPTWRFSRGRCMGPAGTYGPPAGSSAFEKIGLIDTLLRVPDEVGTALGPQAVAASVQATGRSVAVPMWLLAMLTGYLPIRWLVAAEKERAQHKRAGFPVAPLDKDDGAPPLTSSQTMRR